MLWRGGRSRHINISGAMCLAVWEGRSRVRGRVGLEHIITGVLWLWGRCLWDYAVFICPVAVFVFGDKVLSKEQEVAVTIEWFDLEGTLKIICLQPPCHGQGHQYPTCSSPELVLIHFSLSLCLCWHCPHSRCRTLHLAS